MLPSLLLLLRVFEVEKKMVAEKQHRFSNRKMIMNLLFLCLNYQLFQYYVKKT